MVGAVSSHLNEIVCMHLERKKEQCKFINYVRVKSALFLESIYDAGSRSETLWMFFLYLPSESNRMQ